MGYIDNQKGAAAKSHDLQFNKLQNPASAFTKAASEADVLEKNIHGTLKHIAENGFSNGVNSSRRETYWEFHRSYLEFQRSYFEVQRPYFEVQRPYFAVEQLYFEVE